MKTYLFLASLAFSVLFTNAQPFVLQHDHSTIQVKNIDKSVEFYKSVLLFKEIPTPWPDEKMIRFLAIGKVEQLHIAQVDAFGEVKVNKVLHLAFAVEDFDGYLKFLEEKGIQYSDFNEKAKKPQLRPDGVRQVYFQDPDGYWIEVNDAKH